jgi:hypothetical protein
MHRLSANSIAFDTRLKQAEASIAVPTDRGPTGAVMHAADPDYDSNTVSVMAASTSITPFPFEVTAQSYEYLGAGKMRASLEIKTGETLFYVISTAMLVESVKLAMACMNANLAATMRDTGML